METKDKQELLNNLTKVNPVFAGAAKGHTVVSKSDGKQLIVGRSIKLNGEIDVCESLVVEGTLEANLSSAKCLDIVGGGRFSGSAQVDEAHVSGTFDGELVVNGVLYVYETGVVSGKISYISLIVEKGGVLRGTLKNITAAK
ncbi:MAG: polymer-forming cytoskeletal protein [Rickettsiales bacterium]|jgi:cytoskeletal protein CcmA (bactofilin family)|nr:polymer-forming cytoskeletal protein [Rickettsiales bacterium]